MNEESQNCLKIGDESPVIINKRPGRPGRKPKAKIQSQNEEGKDADACLKDYEKEIELEKTAMSNFSIFYIDVLDTLVSPLKKDYPFGNDLLLALDPFLCCTDLI